VLYTELPESPYRPLRRALSGEGLCSHQGIHQIRRHCTEVNCHRTGNLRFLSFCLRPGTAAEWAQGIWRLQSAGS
jgi:hypothetical protein